jgi:uncharacterized protein YqeY
MSITSQLQSDMKDAMRARDQQRLDTIRMALSSIKNARIELGHEPDDVEAIEVLQKEAKRRREAASEYHKANRPDLAALEEAELAILVAYVPAMLDAAALRPLVAQVIEEIGAKGIADLSKLMTVLKQRFRGQAEGRTINEVARELLTS